MKGMKGKIAAVMLWLFGAIANAQTLPPEVTRMLEEIVGEETNDEITILYEELARRKPNINLLDREALEATHLLSSFQIESILDHRQHFGDILSVGELAIIDGFNQRKAQLCSWFFSFTSHSTVADTIQKTSTHSGLAKAKKTFGTEGIGVTAKYRGEVPLTPDKELAFGITLDSDAGEKLSSVYHPDFTSAHIQYQTSKVKLIAGDYSVRFGQGLTVWKAFSINTTSSPSDLIRRGHGPLPYRSTDEANFFRGAAVTFKAGKFDISPFISYNALDARIVGDTAYTSIITGGYHRTATELAKRRTMHELAGGIGISREFGSWHVGLTAIAYGYDKLNGRTVKDYNLYQIYDGVWGNVGIDIYTYWKHFRLGAEVAIDFGGHPAAIASIIWSPDWSFEMGLSARAYSKKYIATHAGAYSTLSSCSNQEGIVLSLKWLPTDRWTLKLQGQYSYYGWPRYNIPSASSAYKGKLSYERAIGEYSSVDAEIRYNCNWEGKGKEDLLYGRLNTLIALSRWVAIEARLAANDGGIAAFAGGKVTLLKGQLSISARITAYDTNDYDHRIYFYETDLPQSYSTKSYYGKGLAYYGVVRYAPRLKNKKMKPELWVKVSQGASSIGFYLNR